MMNNKAFYDISNGLYLVSVANNDKISGCIINTFMQVASEPKSVIISLNKDNYTTELIKEKKSFHVSILSKKTTMDFIKVFGFARGKEKDKFEGFNILNDSLNNPYIKDFSVSDFTCEVSLIEDVGTHLLIVAIVRECNKYNDDEVLTYSYYHNNLKGTTPKNAVSYQESKGGYTCQICGYTYEGEELPEGFVCPICGAPITMMKKN